MTGCIGYRNVHQGATKTGYAVEYVSIVAAAVMPSARNIQKDRRYLGKRMALLAWKLDGRGTVVDDVVVPSSGVVDDSLGVYRRLRGKENSKYKASILQTDV